MRRKARRLEAGNPIKALSGRSLAMTDRGFELPVGSCHESTLEFDVQRGCPGRLTRQEERIDMVKKSRDQ